MVEDALALGTAALVAVMVAVAALDTVGAVNNPLVEMVPALALHRTCELVDPWTVAASCCVEPDVTVALAGLTVTVTPPTAGVTRIVEEAAAFASATLVAVTMARKLALIAPDTVGAVNKPLEVIVPALALHITCVFSEP